MFVSVEQRFGNSFLFLDINECSDGNHVCDVNSNCNNTDGSHICTCKEGYTGDGQSCQGWYAPSPSPSKFLSKLSISAQAHIENVYHFNY